MKKLGILAGILVCVASAGAQTCPKVAYTTPTTTLKNLVAVVNCLNATAEAPAPAAAKIEAPAPSKGGMQVDAVQIVGPQHSRAYSRVVMAVLSVPTGGTTKTAVVTPEAHEATVTAEAGGSCSVKINSDKTVDSRCYLAGGTVYILYH